MLSRLISIACDKNIFKGITLPGCSTIITHLQYADDVVLFLDNDVNSVRGVRRVLKCFKLLSGLKINSHKSQLYGFSDNADNVQMWANILGCEVGLGAFKYLGANIGESPRLISYWDPLIKKVDLKLKSWDAESISMAGRLILIKSALDSLPTYWFSLYKIPETLIKKLEQVRRSFLWGSRSVGDSKRKRMHLIKWEKVCSSKQVGGLGLVPLRLKNNSLLAKWWWRTYTERDRFWNRVLQEKYGKFFSIDLSQVVLGNDSSYIIKDMLGVQGNLRGASLLSKDCFHWKIGNGELIELWEDAWYRDGTLMDLFPRLYSISRLKFFPMKFFLSLWEEKGVIDISLC